MKALTRCSAPRKYITTYLGLSVGFAGLPPRLMYQGSHGTFAQISGVPRDSAWLATVLTVSGVDDASSRSTPSFKMAVLARSPARVGLDCESDRKSTRLNSSHVEISYAVFCLKKKITACTSSRLHS